MGTATKIRHFILRQGLPRLLFTAILSLHLLVTGAWGQDTGPRVGQASGAQSGPAAGGSGQSRDIGFGSSGPGIIAGSLPGIFKRRLVSRFSVSEVYDRGITNGNYSDSRDTYTEASASFLYELNRKHSDYTFDYRGSARHYNRFQGLDTLSHGAGIVQVVRWTPRLTTSLGYRYTFTPDFTDEPLQESIAWELSLSNPTPGPLTLPIPAEGGLVTLRSARMLNRAQAQLTYQPSLYTRFSIRGGFQRERYQDDNLFSSENANIAARAERSLTRRTVIGLTYQGHWYHQAGGVDRTLAHHGNLSLSRELTPHMTISLTGGRWWSFSEGQTAIALSPVLSFLLGTPSLLRDTSQSFSSWTGSANFKTQWQQGKVNFGLAYNRSLMANNLLSRPADTQSFSLSLGKQFGESTFFSGSLAYQQNEFFSLRDSGRLDHGVARVTFSRKLISGLDFSIFCNYSKILKGAIQPSQYDHMQAGIRFVFHLPRVRSS